MTRLSRRDFLKLGAAFSASASLSSWLPFSQSGNKKNVLILLFDTLSARHLSLYGYPRETTPHLSRFAERATVYHSHYSASNFTSPATASMLLGMYPWHHRAYNQRGLVRRDLVDRNLFALLGNDFYRFSFAQTEWADVLMNQFRESMERNLPPSTFSSSGTQFFRDRFTHERLLVPYLAETLSGRYLELAGQLHNKDYHLKGFPGYPEGIPVIEDIDVAFRLEDVFAGVLAEIREAAAKPQPHFSYYHLFAPHNPFRPRAEFIDLFKDGYKPVKKPDHPLSIGEGKRKLSRDQQMYDRYIANVDDEFGSLVQKLETDGLLEDTYVIVTSDHGELFERATVGHGGPLMFDSVIHIPLLIRAPGQSSRSDVHGPTSNLDLYPTLLSLCGKEMPQNVEGRVLPGFGGVEDASRSIYAMVSPRSSAFGPLRIGTFVLQRHAYKLIYYRGYENYSNIFELYNLVDDPDELHDLFKEQPSVARQMKAELLTALEKADEPYL